MKLIVADRYIDRYSLRFRDADYVGIIYSVDFFLYLLISSILLFCFITSVNP